MGTLTSLERGKERLPILGLAVSTRKSSDLNPKLYPYSNLYPGPTPRSHPWPEQGSVGVDSEPGKPGELKLGSIPTTDGSVASLEQQAGEKRRAPKELPEPVCSHRGENQPVSKGNTKWIRIRVASVSVFRTIFKKVSFFKT